MSAKRSPFFVVSLPRSRSKWLSTFLSYKPKSLLCGHDMLVDCGSIADFQAALRGVNGTCETALVVGWKIIRDRYPDSKIIVIERDLADIVISCRRHGLEPDMNQLIERKEMLDMLSYAPGVHSFPFAHLAHESVCKLIFEHLLEIDFDVEWWKSLKDKNIQIDLSKRQLELQSNFPRLRELHTEVIAEAQKLGSAQHMGLN